MEQIQLTNIEKKFISELQIGSKPEKIKNSFGGNEIVLDPQAVAIHDFIKGAELSIAMGNRSLVSDFDMARNLFRKLYPDAYYDLLD